MIEVRLAESGRLVGVYYGVLTPNQLSAPRLVLHKSIPLAIDDPEISTEMRIETTIAEIETIRWNHKAALIERGGIPSEIRVLVVGEEDSLHHVPGYWCLSSMHRF